jgi:hypothetical protein
MGVSKRLKLYFCPSGPGDQMNGIISNTNKIVELLDLYYLEEDDRYDDEIYNEICQIAYSEANTEKITDDDFFTDVNLALENWKNNIASPSQTAENVIENVLRWSKN